MIRILRLLVAGAAPFLLAAADSGSPLRGMEDTVVAEVGGVRLTLGTLEQQRANALFQAENSFYEAEKKVVGDLVDDYLLSQEAKKEGVTVQQLLKKHVDDAIDKNISEDALKVYYEGLDTNEPYEAVRDKIIEHVHAKRLAKAKSTFLQSLRDQTKITILVSSARAQVNLNDTPVRGPAGARVTVVEYADYECPYCQQMQPVIDKLEADYKGKIAFAYKDLPLPMHPHAQKAAEAAQCAGVQNKYWEYHDLLLKTRQLEVPQLKSAARQLNLDVKQFDACLDSGVRAEAVKATIDEATKLGMQGTPSFFINGRYVSGVLPYEQLKQIVDEELNRSAAQTASTKH
jgi:protein-disulfide isomerase